MTNELDEIISFFSNKLIICGSLCDVVYVNFPTPIHDYDFIINKDDFFKHLQASEESSTINVKDICLKKSKNITFGLSQYLGTYKQIHKIDFFLADDNYENTVSCTNISSKYFVSNSIYPYYRIQTMATRKIMLEQLQVHANKIIENYTTNVTMIAWKHLKLKQIAEKLPLYIQQLSLDSSLE